jgi:hypothetical protein
VVNPRRLHPSQRPARPALARVALVALAGLGVLGLTACSVTNPMTTKNDYAASDGVRVDLGEATVINLLVLTAAEGEPGTVLGAVANHGRERVTVTVALAADAAQDTSFDVAGGGTVVIGPERDETLDLDSTPAAPGTLIELTLTSDRGGSTTVQVPVLDGTLSQYADLVP